MLYRRIKQLLIIIPHVDVSRLKLASSPGRLGKLTLVGGLLGTFLVLLLVMLCFMATTFIAVRQYRQKSK